jgi:plastocyanin
MLVGVAASATYPSLTLTALPAAASGNETITLNGTAPAGLSVQFLPNSVKLNTDSRAYVGLVINSSQSITPGDYTVKVGLSYGAVSKFSSITVRVVQYLIYETGNAFSPSALTVTQGSTVYWINLDTPGADPEIHQVNFTSGATAVSPDMMQFDTYHYTFTAPGTYSYFCKYHVGMMGTITVTA